MGDTPMFKGLKLTELEKTCGACPAQWDGKLEDGRCVYVRFRWGWLQVGIGATKDEAIGQRCDIWFCGDDFLGIMEEGEMLRRTGFELVQ